ncbi:MAG: DUF1073 domain-containing protein [Candidatus Moranbacteria bacterium]|nr:DUF1073 domain-containing protein [Candidatus Moranbacteria bacterium]
MSETINKNIKNSDNKTKTLDVESTKAKVGEYANILKGIITKDAFQNEMAKLGFGQNNLLEGTTYPLTRMTPNVNLFNSMYRGSWIVRKIIDVPPTDMIKNWIKFTSELEPEKLKRINKVVSTTKTKSKILEALKWGRLYGGAAALLLIDGHEQILDKPLDYDDVMLNSYKGLLVFDRWSGIRPSSEMITDIGDPEFGLPMYYEIFASNNATFKVHHSRILRFPGRDLPYFEKMAEMYWGESEIEVVFEELKKRDNTSYNIAYLVFLANIRVLKMESLGQMLSVNDSDVQRELYNVLEAQNTLMSNMGIYVMDKDDEFDTSQYSFSGLDEIYQSFMLDVAGAAEMPVTKLFGREPSGWNSTGESDLTQYYDSISEKQEMYLRPILSKLIPIICLSELGAIPDDFEWEFNPVMNISNQDLADLADKYTTNITSVYQSGLVDKATALRELKSQADVTGQWSNITDEMIASAENEFMSGEEESDIEKEISLEGSESASDEPKIESNNTNQSNNNNVLEFKRKDENETWRDRLLKAMEEKNEKVKEKEVEEKI